VSEVIPRRLELISPILEVGSGALSYSLTLTSRGAKTPSNTQPTPGGECGQGNVKCATGTRDDVSRCFSTYRAHQRVEDADGEGCATSERLSHVEFGVWVVVVVLVEELYVCVVTCSTAQQSSDSFIARGAL